MHTACVQLTLNLTFLVINNLKCKFEYINNCIKEIVLVTNLKFSWFGSLATNKVANNTAVAPFIANVHFRNC